MRKRLGNFIVAEDDDTLEGIVLGALKRKSASLSVVETFTGGRIAARLTLLPDAESVFRRGLVAQAGSEIEELLNLADGTLSSGPLTEKAMEDAARATLLETHSTYALVALRTGRNRGLGCPAALRSGSQSRPVSKSRCGVADSPLRR